MDLLIRLRDKCKEVYADYDIVIRPVLKFGLAVMVFMIINSELGYLSTLNNLFVLIILAVICAILPLNGIVVIGTLLIIAHCFGLGMEVGGFAAILYLLMVLLYFRFAPKDALAILLTPAAFIARVPVAVPLCLGQIRGPLSAITIVFGIFSWQFVHSVPTVIEPLKNVPDASMLDILQAMPNALLTRDTILRIIIFVAVLLIVSAVRRLGSDYAHEVGIVVGAVAYLFLEIIGGRILGVDVDFKELLIGTVGSLLIAFFLKIFYFSADYTASERLLFEDDRYYYRVKVIPKRMPVDSRTGEELEPESDDEVPEIDIRRFRKMREQEIEKKFAGINLQTRLERSLREFGGGFADDAEGEGEPEAAAEAAPDETSADGSGMLSGTAPETASEEGTEAGQEPVQDVIPDTIIFPDLSDVGPDNEPFDEPDEDEFEEY